MSKERNIKNKYSKRRNKLVNEQNLIVITNCDVCVGVQGKRVFERESICSTCRIAKKIKKIGKELVKNTEMKRAEIWNTKRQTTGSACRRTCN